MPKLIAIWAWCNDVQRIKPFVRGVARRVGKPTCEAVRLLTGGGLYVPASGKTICI